MCVQGVPSYLLGISYTQGFRVDLISNPLEPHRLLAPSRFQQDGCLRQAAFQPSLRSLHQPLDDLSAVQKILRASAQVESKVSRLR